MKKLSILFSFCFLSMMSFSQSIDTSMISKIRNEAFNKSETMKMVTTLCERIGPRPMATAPYDTAAAWIAKKMFSWNITSVKNEKIGQSFRGWRVKTFYATQTLPFSRSLNALPKSCSPGLSGVLKSTVVFLDAKEEKDFDQYKGKLKGKIVFITNSYTPQVNFQKMIPVLADTTLQRMSEYIIPDAEAKKKEKDENDAFFANYLEKRKFISKKIAFCQKEGAALLVDNSARPYGMLQIWANSPATEPTSVFGFLADAGPDPNIPQAPPQITLPADQYASILRQLKEGADVNLEIKMDVIEDGVKEGYNLIAEIPGTSKKNEIVLIGAHLDNYPAGTGATDNTINVATVMEVARIFKTLNIQPSRTIRFCFWGAEEQGLRGSKAYIKNHFATGSSEKCYISLNADFGSGKFRGLYAEENTGAADMFKEWMKLINRPEFKTVCLKQTINSDHEAFQNAGLPGFQFIQDPLDYYVTFHSTQDVIERIPAGNPEYNAYILAALTYMAATQSKDFPSTQKK